MLPYIFKANVYILKASYTVQVKLPCTNFMVNVMRKYYGGILTRLWHDHVKDYNKIMHESC